MENNIVPRGTFKPSVKGRQFKVKEGNPYWIFQIDAHDTLPDDHFVVWGGNYSFGYKKTTVWEQIDRGQWILLP